MPEFPHRTTVLHRVLLVAALVATLTSASAPAFADDTDDAAGQPTVRWSVTPADENGPDGRTAVELDVDPGETVSDHFAVRNVSADEVTFRLTAADGFYTRTGRFDILPADQESVDSGTWISIPDEVTVAPGATVVVPFGIAVPETAEPGDHAAGITASVLSVQTGDGGTSVGVESRVGFRVLTRVTGEIAPAAAVTDLGAQYALSWNPFRPGEITVTFDVVNEGNTRLIAEGAVEAGGRSVVFPAEDGIRQELLPGDTRTLTAVVEDVWPLFVVPTTVTLSPIVVTMDGESSTLTPVVASVPAWAVPWPQLIILAGLALVIWAVLRGRTRSRRRIDALVAEAREAGRREAEKVDAP
ncbi:WxL protein peptidoglycan domain-containing protein [Microbacterium cremeum]|uniref:WxL protein peptidoglycan domain-containing protein n=1 Tax=Microbacterium cremeum TaxID=2782169 RepID=UPI0018879F12|nr:DUF916 domain-containing protein [Microbacterium cremeum]